MYLNSIKSISIFVVVLILCIASKGALSASPTAKDIIFDSKGQLVIKGWLSSFEDYTICDSTKNRVFNRGKNSVTYGNRYLLIKKQIKLEKNRLKILLQVIPRTRKGKTSDFILHVRFSQPFRQFYIPYAYSSPAISGRFIKAGEMKNIKEGYKGACTNSMKYCLFIGTDTSVMFDRVSHNGFPTYGGPSLVSGDLKEMVFPLFGYYGHISWNPGQLEPVKTWRGNVYNPVYDDSKVGGQLELDINFIPTSEPEKAQKQASQLYFLTRRKLEENKIYSDWAEYVRPPKNQPAFCAFVGGNWAGGLEKIGNSWITRLKEMRNILDENGLADSPIYFWVMLYSQKEKSAGWGIFPLNDKVYKSFCERLRAIPNIKIGVYVNYWCCSVNARVYKEHPEWFTAISQKCDGGDDGYWAKLPGWGKYMAEEMPKLVKSYNLDFVFLDNAGIAPIICGTIEQQRKYARQLSEALHRVGAFIVGNGRTPFLDVQYLEVEAGKSIRQDADWAENFHYMSSRKWILGPEISRSGKFAERSYKAFLKWYAPHPEFCPRFPIHYGGNMYNHMINKVFKPYVKIRSVKNK